MQERQMRKQKQINLIEGPILKTLVALAIPIMASSFLNTVYSITDMAWIGMLGSKAVAGVGVGGMFVWLSQGLSSLARMGGQVNLAQSIGKGDRAEASQYAKAAVQMVVVFAGVFAAFCLVFADRLVGFFHLGDAESISCAVTYLRITCGLIIFSYCTQVLTGIYTAQGDSKTPLKANLLGLALNMIFDPVLILGIGPFPRLGTTGAAVATVGAQCVVMLVMILAVVMKADSENVLKHVCLFTLCKKKYYRNIFHIGVPTAIQGSLYCLISMVLARMSAVFGAGAVAVQRLGGQIESVSWNTSDGFAAAINAFTGQNYGAGKWDRVKKGYWNSFWITSAWGAIVTACFVLFPEQLSGIFFYEEDVLRMSVHYMVIVGLSQAFMCVEIVTIGALSGLGKTKLCSVISVLLTGSRIPLAYVLCNTKLGLDGIWITFSVTSIMKGIIFTIAYAVVTSKMLCRAEKEMGGRGFER